MDKDRRLFVYGTLAPGEENAHVLTHCRGDWKRASVTGRLVDTGSGTALGFPALQIDPEGEKVAGWLLQSDDLPASWPALDKFEGKAYRRSLVMVELEFGETLAASAYLSTPTLNFRNAKNADAEIIADLNEAVVSVTSPMTAAQFLELKALSRYCLVVETASDKVDGFIIVMTKGEPYDNGNYRWFSGRYDDFAYIDRIVLGPSLRNLGVAHQLYDLIGDLAAEDGCNLLAAEMDIDPPNPHSLHFHDRYGFKEVGVRDLERGKTVSMQVAPIKRDQ
ncbi:MAG: GNAT family N-acetyltransferase [Luminiphilus sp.]|nr:GNAT family N-acetyltransferase [Luminiphilus sp.]